MKMKTRDIAAYTREFAKELLFPGKCPICRDAIPFERRIPYVLNHKDPGWVLKENAYAAIICEECREELLFVGENRCGKCGKQLRSSNETGLCSDCREKIRSFREGRVLLTYDETAKQIISDIKYHGILDGAELLAAAFLERFGDWIKSTKADMIIPVPIHKERRRMRGFNQAEEIAERIGKPLGIPVRNDILVRNKSTKAQKDLDVEQRLLNLMDAFSLLRRPGKRVILLDDIYTTGATMEACTLMLLHGGAEEVYSACMCAPAEI